MKDYLGPWPLERYQKPTALWFLYLGINIEQAALEEMRVRAAVERLRDMLAQKTIVCSPGRPVFPGFPWDSLDWAAWGY